MSQRTSPQFAVLLGMLLCTVLAACSHKAAEPAPTTSAPITSGAGPPMASSESAEFDTNDPCNLLEPKEVEAVLGAPLAVAPFRGTTPYLPNVSAESCVYTTAKFQFITLEVTWKDGAQTFAMTTMAKKLLGSAPDPSMKAAIKKAFKLDDGTELAGEWDEATLMAMNCCIFVALRGDQTITVDFTGSDATLKQAATLVNAAFKRIDTPLAVNGGANVAAAKQLAAQRRKPVDACSLLTRAEVEAILGKLSAEPVGRGTDSCAYELPAAGIRQLYEVQLTWAGGYTKWREDGFVSQMAAGTMAKMSADVAGPGAENVVLQALGNQGETGGASWDRAEVRGVKFMAVKKDVMAQIDLRMGKQDPAIRLMAAVMSKI